MERNHVLRRSILFTGLACYGFLLLSLGSFHATDWPSHQVFPHPPVQNLCGQAGAFVAYYLFLGLGHGVFPLLLMGGAALAMIAMRQPPSDLWLRAAGTILLAVAVATLVHHVRPGSHSSFPEGYGGIIGISTASFLQSHFSTVGTRLVLLTAVLVGMLLSADELLLRAPRVVVASAGAVRSGAGRLQGVRELLARLRIRRRSGAPVEQSPDARVIRPAKPARPPRKAAPPAAASIEDAQDDEPLKPPVLLAPSKPASPPQDADEEDEEDAAAAAPQAEAPKPAPKKDIIVRLPSTLKPRQVSPPPPRELGEYTLPPWEHLADAEHGFAEAQEKFVRDKAAVLEQALREFQIDAQVVEIDTGPVITMYELSLAPGIKVSSITALSNDIARALAATSVRIVAPVPGKHTVGIEVPNAQKEKVRLKELMQLAPDAAGKMAVPLFLGKDASGEPLIADLAAMPHCLIAGTTGSGKSVCINTVIMSILYKQRPDMVKLILVDPKVVEMAPFKEIPHLMCPVINDTGKATSVLDWACEKMDERYDLLAEAGVRNIKGYNSLTKEELFERFKPSTPEEEAKIPKHLPYIVIIIDELADLMMTSGKEVESFIVRLAQKSRAVGIHLILATQRPQANVVTGLIKSNMPSRIAFRVSSKMDSRIVLDQNGADLLLGQGDMLFMPPGASKPIRAQGTYIDDLEIKESVRLVRGLAEAQYEPDLVQIKTPTADGAGERDELFDDAVRVVLETRRGSVSLLQRRLTIGYSRASRLIEQMAEAGIVGEYKGSQAREAMLTLEEWDAMVAQRDAESGMTV